MNENTGPAADAGTKALAPEDTATPRHIKYPGSNAATRAAMNILRVVVMSGSYRNQPGIRRPMFKRTAVNEARGIIAKLYNAGAVSLVSDALADPAVVDDYIRLTVSDLLTQIMDYQRKLIAAADAGDVLDIGTFRYATILSNTVLALHSPDIASTLAERAASLVRVAANELRGLPPLSNSTDKDVA